MRRSLSLAGVLLTTTALCGCNRAGSAPASRTTTHTTTTPETAPETGPNRIGPGAKVDAGPNGATATGQTAGGDGVDVDVAPGGGVDVEVQGEPIRDRLRERRASREENLPR